MVTSTFFIPSYQFREGLTQLNCDGRGICQHAVFLLSPWWSVRVGDDFVTSMMDAHLILSPDFDGQKRVPCGRALTVLNQEWKRRRAAPLCVAAVMLLEGLLSPHSFRCYILLELQLGFYHIFHIPLV